MVVLVTGTPMFPGKNAFVKALLDKFPNITTIIQNINHDRTSMVLGNTEKILYGKGFIEDELCGCRFRISAKSFYQINPVQTEVLYGKAVEFAQLNGTETVIDAYCGIGTIGIIAAKNAKSVVGVELNKDAVSDAKINAQMNKTENIRFYCADAGEFMVNMAADGEKADVVFMDPPRAGSDIPFLKSVVTLSPEKIVYISCNPETQARDLAFLTRNGYKVRKIQPVDMFPHTAHVETVVLLVRYISTKEHVTITVKPEELELGSLQTHGTYEEIKKYVLDKYGLKISTLNISQVKRKCGLDVGDAYNKPKNPNSRVPNCTKEKEDAIMDALKYFGMI